MQSDFFFVRQLRIPLNFSGLLFAALVPLLLLNAELNGENRLSHTHTITHMFVTDGLKDKATDKPLPWSCLHVNENSFSISHEFILIPT